MSIYLLERPQPLEKMQLHLPRVAVMEWIVRGFDWIYDAQERARQRRQLLRLDDRLLCDIGISRSDAISEARKPFWRK